VRCETEEQRCDDLPNCAKHLFIVAFYYYSSASNTPFYLSFMMQRNPNYMLENCKTSCAKAVEAAAAAEAELNKIGSFFELSANDLEGNPIDFESFRGKITVVTNVASYCGYTESHYQQLVDMWNKLGQDENNFNILAFPCNQFGQQEPGTPEEIRDFVTKKGVNFTMMEKVDVNGPHASMVYKYLKKVTGLDSIHWNFATYFVIGPDGNVREFSEGVEPRRLSKLVEKMLNDEL